MTVNIRETGTTELCLVLRWVFQRVDLRFNGYRLLWVSVAVDKSLYFLILINSIYKMWWNTGFKNYTFLLYLSFAAWKDCSSSLPAQAYCSLQSFFGWSSFYTLGWVEPCVCSPHAGPVISGRHSGSCCSPGLVDTLNWESASAPVIAPCLKSHFLVSFVIV